MSREGETQDYVGRLEDTIKKNEEKISDLEEQISALEEQLKDHNENCAVEINDLRRKIEKLESENDDLRHQITELKKSNDFLDKRVKQLEMSEDQLCIGQLLYDVEKNICKFVLEEFYNEYGDHNPNFMLDRIDELIEDESKQQEAKDRWGELKQEIGWKPYVRKEMKAITKKRNVVAHPSLTEESIRKAKESLMAKGQLSENMSKKVDAFTSMWKQTKSKLEAKKPDPESANEKQVGGSRKRKHPQKALPCKRQRLLGSQDGQSMNEEELRKKEQELQEKEKEIEELKRKEKDVQHELQQQAQENKILTTRIEELKEEIESLNAEIKKQKEELEEIKENQHYLFLAAMCDQLLKNFYEIVFYPHDFSHESKQSYKVVNIEYDIREGRYGLTTEEDKYQARKRWEDLKKWLAWDSQHHVRGIKQLKYDSNRTAHPKITKDMKESLEERANALNHERKLNEPTFGIVQNLIEMWFKTEDLVQEQEKKKNKEQTA